MENQLTKEQDSNMNRKKFGLSLQMRRRLLKRSKALSMEQADKLAGRSSLLSLPEMPTDPTEEDGEMTAFPNLPDNVLRAVGLFNNLETTEGNKNLNEPDIEERFARLALAFKTDKFTLSKRLDLQRRQRDIAEKNIDAELGALRESLNALNQLCTESDMRDIITKTQQHVDIVQQATLRMSNRAETYGAIQQEERLNCAFETMLNYVEHLKLLYDKEHLELEEYRRLLAEHNLLPAGEKSSSVDGDDIRRTTLPPRSHSLSSSSKPDSRTRLLSAVCLLNNNYESPRTPPNGNNNNNHSSQGSTSPKSRRSSLPVGPLSSSQGIGNTPPIVRTHQSIHEMAEEKKKMESPDKPSSENESLKIVGVGHKEEAISSKEQQPEEHTVDKDMN